MRTGKKNYQQIGNNMEPDIAFPYKPPSEDIKKKYAYIFELDNPPKIRISKLIFDKLFASILILLSLPIVVILKLSYLIEGLVKAENAGPLLFYYYGISGGKRFKKYKFRIIKESCINRDLAKVGDWRAYQSEWKEECRTYTGHIIKKFYLDEIPQFFLVLMGDMSIVGPRPLSEIHYNRDLAQGNVTRKFLRGGLLGLGHINKGTDQMGLPDYEYEYLDAYINLSFLRLIFLDLWIIKKGISLIFKGGGH